MREFIFGLVHKIAMTVAYVAELVWTIVLVLWHWTFGLTAQMLMTADYNQLSSPKQVAYVLALVGIPLAIYAIWIPITAAIEYAANVLVLLIGSIMGNWAIVLTALFLSVGGAWFVLHG